MQLYAILYTVHLRLRCRRLYCLIIFGGVIYGVQSVQKNYNFHHMLGDTYTAIILYHLIFPISKSMDISLRNQYFYMIYRLICMGLDFIP